MPEDITIVSSDSVYFQAHQTYLLHFEELTSGGPVTNEEHSPNVLHLPESGSVLNLLLSAAYNTTRNGGQVGASDISLSDLGLAVAALKTYGIPLQAALAEKSLMSSAFESHCQRGPTSALQVYAIAASHVPDLHVLAVYASEFLLSLSLASISEEQADKIDPAYVRKLFILHLDRIKEFKQLMTGLPQTHGPLPRCNDTGGGVLLDAWARATAYLSWAASADLPNSKIDDVMMSVMDRFTCTTCKESLQCRFRILKQEWLLVKRTI
ncbi:hypothetical protein SCHPADRAFT_155320 [Schizopora paradoxa]|uniref:Uncharacterized protein n=1 Tax=Schizopora paradoxa TaxID=27342 RepID=A0A0H2S1D4_9AGAM|nr:hypothetical protein SCHPADRAFT_155320 [Schizopora paradoxa]